MNMMAGDDYVRTRTDLTSLQCLSTPNRSTSANYRKPESTVVWAGLENLILISRVLLMILVSHQFVTSLSAGHGRRDGMGPTR